MRHGQGSIEVLDRVEFVPSRPEVVERAPDDIHGGRSAVDDPPSIEQDIPPPNVDSSRVREPVDRYGGVYTYPIYQSQNYFMRQWLENYRFAFEEAILAGEVPTSAGRECYCGNVADWRCDDCLGTPIHCLLCLHKAHALIPWHRVSRWHSDGYYTPWSLPQTGMNLHCGHGGNICPTRAATELQTGLQVRRNARATDATIYGTSTPYSTRKPRTLSIQRYRIIPVMSCRARI